MIFNLIKSLRRTFLDSFEFLIRKTMQTNSHFFYGSFYGSDFFPILLFKNILIPKPTLKKAIYGQIPFLMGIRSSKQSTVSNHFEELQKNGITFLEGKFSGVVDKIIEDFDLRPERFTNDGKYRRLTVDLFDREILSLVSEPEVLELLSLRYGRQPYLRQHPGFNCTFPKSQDRGKREGNPIGYNDKWHYDTPNLMTVHILLTDIDEGDCHMLYAKKSHRKLRSNLNQSDYWFSENYVRDKYEITPCIGKKGTAIIFDPNGLHRLNIVEDTCRMILHFNYTPGNDAVTSKGDMISGSLENYIGRYSSLPSDKRELIKLLV